MKENEYELIFDALYAPNGTPHGNAQKQEAPAPSESPAAPSENASAQEVGKRLNLWLPMLALACEIVGILPALFDMLSPRLGWDIHFPWILFLFVFVGMGLAVTGICLRKKTKTAGIVLSVVALCNPMVVLGLIYGLMYTVLFVSLLIFGM